MKNIFYLMILVLVFSGCKKTSQHVLITDEQFYFKGYVNGVYVNWSLSAYPKLELEYGGNFGYRRNNEANLYFVLYQYVSHIKAIPQTPDPEGGYRDTSSISINFITPQKPPSFDYVLNYFLPGSKQFAIISTSNTDSISEGISISYCQQTAYMSGFGDQGTSSFQSIELKDAPGDKEYTKIWTARFSCKVYQPYLCNDTGYHPTKIIEIKDAEIRLPLFRQSDYF